MHLETGGSPPQSSAGIVSINSALIGLRYAKVGSMLLSILTYANMQVCRFKETYTSRTFDLTHVS